MPWLLSGCERPPKVKISRWYGTNESEGFDGHVTDWVEKKQVSREAWCADCKLLDKVIDPKLGSVL